MAAAAVAEPHGCGQIIPGGRAYSLWPLIGTFAARPGQGPGAEAVGKIPRPGLRCASTAGASGRDAGPATTTIVSAADTDRRAQTVQPHRAVRAVLLGRGGADLQADSVHYVVVGSVNSGVS